SGTARFGIEFAVTPGQVRVLSPQREHGCNCQPEKEPIAKRDWGCTWASAGSKQPSRPMA
ncbi:MAG: hypothetical protein M3Y27_24280, partial [Acidobacteriota bacterium]|nr:hypothetical protein [Acidobacteriota bacterium]